MQVFGIVGMPGVIIPEAEAGKQPVGQVSLPKTAPSEPKDTKTTNAPSVAAVSEITKAEPKPASRKVSFYFVVHGEKKNAAEVSDILKKEIEKIKEKGFTPVLVLEGIIEIAIDVRFFQLLLNSYLGSTYEKVSKNERLLKFIASHNKNFRYHEDSGSLVVIGEMKEEEKSELLTCFDGEEDKKAVERLFQQSRLGKGLEFFKDNLGTLIETEVARHLSREEIQKLFESRRNRAKKFYQDLSEKGVRSETDLRKILDGFEYSNSEFQRSLIEVAFSLNIKIIGEEENCNLEAVIRSEFFDCLIIIARYLLAKKHDWEGYVLLAREAINQMVKMSRAREQKIKEQIGKVFEDKNIHNPWVIVEMGNGHSEMTNIFDTPQYELSVSYKDKNMVVDLMAACVTGEEMSEAEIKKAILVEGPLSEAIFSLFVKKLGVSVDMAKKFCRDVFGRMSPDRINELMRFTFNNATNATARGEDFDNSFCLGVFQWLVDNELTLDEINKMESLLGNLKK